MTKITTTEQAIEIAKGLRAAGDWTAVYQANVALVEQIERFAYNASPIEQRRILRALGYRK